MIVSPGDYAIESVTDSLNTDENVKLDFYVPYFKDELINRISYLRLCIDQVKFIVAPHLIYNFHNLVLNKNVNLV